jgi:hypothetical protein
MELLFRRLDAAQRQGLEVPGRAAFIAHGLVTLWAPRLLVTLGLLLGLLLALVGAGLIGYAWLLRRDELEHGRR